MNMLQTLKETGKDIGTEIGRAWDSLSDGWRDLLSRSNSALTRFTRAGQEKRQDSSNEERLPRWGLLAGELAETAKEVVVRVELPGLDKEDCEISIEGNVLQVRGEKRFERESSDSTYHVMQRAYGAFQRSIALPRNVDTEHAQASFKNGVLTVRLPKEGSDQPRRIAVS